jgi:flagellar basal body-associated protein FliL
MKKKIILITAGLLALLAISALIAVKTTAKPAPIQANNKIILYYKEACPFCLNVEKFMAENKVEEKITLEKKEVHENKDNAAELGQKAEFCKINSNEVGVPFLWDGPNAKCLVGDVDIINFFQQKLNQQ